MRILITAFEPFNNNDVNFSHEVLKKMTSFEGVIKETLPVEYTGSFKQIEKVITKHQPNIIIMLGEARSYTKVGFEVIAINEVSNHPDNKGIIPQKRQILDGGPDGLFSTLDYELFNNAMSATNTAFFRSFSAGTYVCNALFYQTQNYIKQNKLDIKSGFIHIPDLGNDDIDNIVSGLNQYIMNLLQN